jgi:predicted secreted hydrolase
VVIWLLAWGCARPPLETPGPVVLPEDHGPHPNAQTEWWYLQGTVQTDDRRLAVFVSFLRHDPRHDRIAGLPIATFGRDARLAFACVADLDTGERLSERWSAGAGVGQRPGASRHDGWVSLEIGRWELHGNQGRTTFDVPTRLGRLELVVTPTTTPMLMGPEGRVDIAGVTNRYYSLPRAELTGSLERAGHREPLRGEGWFDHQYGYVYTPEWAGWWWLAATLDDGTDLMLTQVLPTERNGGQTDALGRARLVGQEATDVAFTFEALGKAPSPRTKAEYPTELRATVPALGIELTATPLQPDSECIVRPVPLWEGTVAIRGTRAGVPVTGTGFAEFVELGEPWVRQFYGTRSVGMDAP